MDQFEEKKWFVFLGDRHEGPFSMAEIRTKIEAKTVSSSSFVWAEGMTDWKLMKEIPAFDAIGKAIASGKASSKSQEKAPKNDVMSIFKAESLPVDKGPLKPTGQPPLTDAQIEKAWKRRRLIRRSLKTAAVLGVVGGGAYVYQQGLLNQYVDVPKIVSMAHTMTDNVMERARPRLLILSEKYPVLSKVISPIPHLKDVSSEDYEALRAAASAHLDQGGPTVTIAAAETDRVRPVFYVTTNLPDGALFDIYIEGVPGSLVGKLRASAKLTLLINKNIGMTEAVGLSRDVPLPLGEYQVFATESDNQPPAVKNIIGSLPPLNAAKTERLPAGLKLLARRTYFFGGQKDEAYTQKLRDYREQMSQKARTEVAELKDIATALSKQIQLTVQHFKSIRKGKGISGGKKKTWSKFHTDWMKEQIAWQERFSKFTPEMLREDYVHGETYDLARQAGQDLQKLHDMQNDYFENRLDERGLDIQLGTTTSVVESSFVALKTKIEQAEKVSAVQTSN